MATFSNDLDSKITFYQTVEQLKYYNLALEKRTKEFTIKSFIILIPATIGFASTIFSDDYHNALLGLTGAALVFAGDQIRRLITTINYKHPKIDPNNLTEKDYYALKRASLDRKRKKGKLEIERAETFYQSSYQNIEEEIPSDIVLDALNHQIVVLTNDETEKQLLHEYDLYSKKYKVPALNITKEELDIFVSNFYKYLKTKCLYHRLYFYLTEYLEYLIISRMVNFVEEITINDFINELSIFNEDSFTLDEISSLEEQIRKGISNLDDNSKYILNKHK